MKIACFCNKTLNSSPLTYTLEFSRDELRDNLTHYMHLKRELELLLGFDSSFSVEVCCVCMPLLCFSVICWWWLVIELQ